MQKTISPTMIELRAEIAKFLVLHDMAPSAFGEAACNDRALVKKLENGRELRYATCKKIEGYMKNHKSNGGKK